MTPPKKKPLPPPSKAKASRKMAKQPEVLPAEDLHAEDLNTEQEDEHTEDAEITDEEIYSQVPAVSSQPPHPTDAELPEPLDAVALNGNAISVHDPLRRYMEEVRRYPLLDPHEEFELAMKLHRDGDLDAAKRLVQANLRLVVKIAFEYRNIYSNMLDLIQEGNVGLMKAVSKFDPAKGARVGYYASWWIRSYILKYLLDNFRLVKIGTTQAQKKLFYHLMREKERLEAQGLLAGPKLLAEKLHVRERDVVEMEQRLSGHGAELSIDTPIDSKGESAATHGDFMSDEHEGADDRLAQSELLRLLERRLPEFEKTLGDKERSLLKDRLLAEEPKTLQEVADLYGLTRERARQIEAKVIQKLREFLKKDIE
ncbi:MAG: RNA polymerase factor sigma-32 [Oligoflexia bacterium]|nr:RNA polymerase factor sigma-32 [Oligoflexia bacterium]